MTNDDRATIFYLPVKGLGIFLGREGQLEGPCRATREKDQDAKEQGGRGLTRTD